MQHRVNGGQFSFKPFSFDPFIDSFQEVFVADIGFYLLFFVRFSSAASMLICRS